MLEYHPHMTPVHVNIHTHICDIDTVEYDASPARILHTIETAQKGALPRPGRPDHCYDIALIDGYVNSFQNLCISEALLKINYVYHSS